MENWNYEQRKEQLALERRDPNRISVPQNNELWHVVYGYFKELFAETTLEDYHYTPERLKSDLWVLYDKAYSEQDIERMLQAGYPYDSEKKAYKVSRADFFKPTNNI